MKIPRVGSFVRNKFKNFYFKVEIGHKPKPKIEKRWEVSRRRLQKYIGRPLVMYLLSMAIHFSRLYLFPDSDKTIKIFIALAGLNASKAIERVQNLETSSAPEVELHREHFI